MNREVLDAVRRWKARGDRVALAQVVRTFGSSPRPVGSLFAISSGGDIAGSVSGGCVEGAIAAEAEDLFQGTGGPRLLRYGIPDDTAFGVGLACGGELWVFLDVAWAPAPFHRGAVATVVAGPRTGRRVSWEDQGSGCGEPETNLDDRDLVRVARKGCALERSRLVELDGEELVFVEVVRPTSRIVVMGAVDTAEALCRVSAMLGWRSVVVDPRSAFATVERLPSADEIVVAWPAKAYRDLAVGPDDAVVVLTHDPKLDDPAIEGALAAGAHYVGALGSRRTQRLRRERLAAGGVPAAELDRVHGPVGLDIGAHTPAETAISIVAEMLARRAGRGGSSLVETIGTIHPRHEVASDI